MKIGRRIKRLVAMSTAMVLLLSCGVLGAVQVYADEAETIEYQGNTVVLSESALYVDQTLTENSAYKFKSLQEAVAAAKPGTKENPMTVKAGDKVIVSKFAGQELKLDGEDYSIVKIADILAIVK